MSCSCRAVSWRTFVRGLAQVHRLDAPAAAHLPASQLGSLAVPRIGRAWAAEREGRGLHTSRCWGQDVSAAGSVREVGDVRQPAETREKSSTAESSSSWTPEQTNKAKSEEEGMKARKRDKYSKARKFEAAEASTRQNRERRDFSKPKGQSRPYKPDTTQQRHGKARGKDRDGESPAEPKQKLEPWQIQKAALKAKFPEGWKPRKRLSPDALAGIRALNAQFPDSYTTSALAKKFEVAPEAIRRILRSKWSPSTEEEERSREERWFRRGKRVWEQKAALGVKPPKMWRMEGVTRDPGYHEWSKRASQREREWEEEEVRKYRESREKRKQQQQQREQGEGGPTRG